MGLREWKQDRTIKCPYCNEEIDAFVFYSQHLPECKEKSKKNEYS